jgi:methionyl-tRNA formyltransferase
MRIVVHGQQAFGKAVLEALLKRGENVVAVYVAPEKPGAKVDPLKEAALAAKLPIFQPASYKDPKVWEEFKALKPDLQVMAFVTLFVPEEFLNMPTHGSIQYHPSLLPAYRGASASIGRSSRARTKPACRSSGPTTASIPAPCCCRRRPRSAHRHARHRLFRPPVPDGRRRHDGIGRPREGRQGAAHQAGRVQGHLRGPLRRRQRQDRLGQALGADRPAHPRLQSRRPAPGPRSTASSSRFSTPSRCLRKDPKGIAGKTGEIAAVEADGFTVVCADGRFKVTRVQPADGKKIEAGEWAKSANVAVKARFT